MTREELKGMRQNTIKIYEFVKNDNDIWEYVVNRSLYSVILNNIEYYENRIEIYYHDVTNYGYEYTNITLTENLNRIKIEIY